MYLGMYWSMLNLQDLQSMGRGVARISRRGVLKNFSAAALAAYARARI